MALIIYGVTLSPPTRAVILTAKYLGIPYELKKVDFMKGEHLTPDYIKINPTRTIPAISDDGFIVFESHAIVLYLIAKYAKSDSLYPRDIKKQAIINQRMYFNSTTLFPKLPEATRDLKSTGSISDTVKARVAESMRQLEILLGDEKWIGGTQNFSIADICIISTLENLNAAFPGKLEAHKKLVAWLERGRDAIDGHEGITRPAVKALSQLLHTKEEDMAEVLKHIAN